MNKRSTNRSFDAAMRLFKTRQRLECGGVGEYEGDRPTLGGVGGLALCAGLGLGHSGGQKVAGGGNLGAGEQVAVVGFHVEAEAAQDFGFAELADGGGRGGFARARAADVVGAGGDSGGFAGVHGGSKSGPIPAMSNPKPVTSDVSSPFFGRIMNGPIPYTVTESGRAIAAAYKKRQEGEK